MDSHWEEFKIEHARAIIAENVREQEKWASLDFTDKWFKAWDGKLRAYTLIVDGVPIACVGLALQEWGKAEAWTLLSASFKDHKLTIYRMIKAGLAMVLGKDLVRVQATIDPSYPDTVRWIESLGFEYEGRLKKFGPPPMHGDFLMYARTN